MVEMSDDSALLDTKKPTSVAMQPVDRHRRFIFVCWVVGGTLGLATLMAVLGGVGAFGDNYKSLVEIFESGLIGIATALSLSYVAGSVIDYNVGSVFPKDKG